jgi:hypothetical protein
VGIFGSKSHDLDPSLGKFSFPIISDVFELILCLELQLKPNRPTVYISSRVAIMQETGNSPPSALNTVVSFIACSPLVFYYWNIYDFVK